MKEKVHKDHKYVLILTKLFSLFREKTTVRLATAYEKWKQFTLLGLSYSQSMKQQKYRLKLQNLKKIYTKWKYTQINQAWISWKSQVSLVTIAKSYEIELKQSRRNAIAANKLSIIIHRWRVFKLTSAFHSLKYNTTLKSV